MTAEYRWIKTFAWDGRFIWKVQWRVKKRFFKHRWTDIYTCVSQAEAEAHIDQLT